jgi:hypothetical protein
VVQENCTCPLSEGFDFEWYRVKEEETHAAEKNTDKEESASQEKDSDKEESGEKERNKKERRGKIHWSGDPNPPDRSSDGHRMASNDYPRSHLWNVVPLL